MEKYLVLILSAIIILFVIELIREEKFTFKYAFGWIFVSSLAIIFTLFDEVLFKAARLLGFELTSDFVLFIFLSAFVFMILMMTVFLCQQNSHNDRIAQKLGILEFEIEQLKKKSDGKKDPPSPKDE
ncbi:MAG TPA: DUF2304 domain-containing protein [Candidatus Omnitrophota bacterium]|nr:DUF2304 domain-containing protein [Candidatus Omnitrophota bacterium]